MRTGRLQSSTLASILRTLDSATNQDSPLASQKQYLPTQFDSPLYRLVTVLQVTEDFRDHDTFAVFEYYMQSRRTRDLAVEIQQTSWRRHPQRGPRTLSVPHIFQPELDPRPSPTRATQSAFDLHLRPGQHAHPRHNLHQGGSQESIFSTGSFGSISQDGQKLCIDVGDQGNVGCSNASSSRDNSPDTKEERVDSSYSTAVLPAPPEVQHLMVTTPALAASSRRRSFESESARRRSLETKATGANSPPKQKRNLDWVRDYAHIDVDWSMQAMDVLYSASFYEYIRDEKNLDLSSIRLARIIKDYKPKQVATALKWMIQGWTVENTAKLMRALFADWLPDLAGCVFYLVSKSWPKRPQLSLCCAYILLSEPAQSVALFLRTLTVTWEKEDTIELISYLDNLLEWSDSYLQEVMRTFTNTKTSMHELNTISTPSMKHHTELDAQVSRLYEQNMQLATYKLALADARLSIAEYKLAILNHCSTCQTCILGETCEVLTKIQPLSRKSSSLEMAPPIPIDINTNISMNSGSAGHSTDKVPSAVQLQSGLLDAVLASDDLASKPSPSTETS